MVTPLQIDSYTRDLWGEFDPLAIAQISPMAYDSCYKPKIIVGLDSQAQNVPAGGYSSAGIRITPGSLILGFLFGNQYSFGGTAEFDFQMSDIEMGHPFWSEPITQSFLTNQKGQNYVSLSNSPYPVVGKGRFLVEVWNQMAISQIIVPLIVTLEPQS